MSDLEPLVLDLEPVELLERFDGVGRVLVVDEAVAVAVAGPVVGYIGRSRSKVHIEIFLVY